MKNIRSRVLFVPQQRIENLDNQDPASVTNVIYPSKNDADKWIQETTERIGDWKNLTRSIYIRWAININALYLAEKRYNELPEDQALQTMTFRYIDGTPSLVPLAVWPSREAAKNYGASIELIAAYAVADLVGAIEDILFDAFKIFLRHDPSKFTVGKQNRELRKIYKARGKTPQAWKVAFEERYSAWRRKRAYDPLYKVLKDYWTTCDLARPSSYKETDIEDWAASILLISELRNLIVHGSATASEELEKYCNIKTNMGFKFKAGQELNVELLHLQSIECFLDQYLVALNISLIEKATNTPSALSLKKEVKPCNLAVGSP